LRKQEVEPVAEGKVLIDLIKNIALFALFFSLVSLLGREGVLKRNRDDFIGRL